MQLAEADLRLKFIVIFETMGPTAEIITAACKFALAGKIIKLSFYAVIGLAGVRGGRHLYGWYCQHSATHTMAMAEESLGVILW